MVDNGNDEELSGVSKRKAFLDASAGDGVTVLAFFD